MVMRHYVTTCTDLPLPCQGTDPDPDPKQVSTLFSIYVCFPLPQNMGLPFKNDTSATVSKNKVQPYIHLINIDVKVINPIMVLHEELNSEKEEACSNTAHYSIYLHTSLIKGCLSRAPPMENVSFRSLIQKQLQRSQQARSHTASTSHI